MSTKALAIDELQTDGRLRALLMEAEAEQHRADRNLTFWTERVTQLTAAMAKRGMV